MPLSSLSGAHYSSHDLSSYLAACKELGRHMWTHPKNRAVLVPLRGGFIPAWIASMDEKASIGKKEYLSFFPTSQFLHDYKTVTIDFLKNYFRERVQRGRQGDPAAFLPFDRSVVHIVDEAKSGRASATLHKYATRAVEELKDEDASRRLEELQDSRSLVAPELKALRGKLEAEVDAQKTRMLEELEWISRHPDDLHLVRSNGDFTRQGIFLLKVLRATGRMSDDEFENMLSHRLLVEQKLGERMTNQTRRHNLPADVQSRIGCDIHAKLNRPEDLAVLFPHLAPYFVKSFHDITPAGLVQSSGFVDHRVVHPDRDLPLKPEERTVMEKHDAGIDLTVEEGRLLQRLLNRPDGGRPLVDGGKHELYESTFATLANYRLQRLLSHLPPTAQFNRLLVHLRSDVQQLARTKKVELRREVGHLEKELKRRQLDRNEEAQARLKSLLMRASDYSNLKIRMLTVHGVDEFISTVPYARLKDEGKLYQFDMNRLFTMDHPVTPLEYYSERSQRGGTIHYPSYNIVFSQEFDNFLHHLGEHPLAQSPSELMRQLGLYTTHFYESARYISPHLRPQGGRLR
ncbi:hypothetical protein HYV43_02590 [Candidatus Micrarchaeota archaeon]|nr:hypothetical protein [Candidatus Micrarchaeota archaeon]